MKAFVQRFGWAVAAFLLVVCALIAAGHAQTSVTGAMLANGGGAKANRHTVTSTCGAKGDGVTDDTAAINTCIAALANGDTLSFTGATAVYKVSHLTTLTVPNVTIQADVGAKLLGSASGTLWQIGNASLSSGQVNLPGSGSCPLSSATADQATSFTVSSGCASALSPGTIVVLWEGGVDGNCSPSGTTQCDSFGSATAAGCEVDTCRMDVVEVLSVSGTTVFPVKPLTHAYDPVANLAGMAVLNNVLTGITINNLTVDGGGVANVGLYINGTVGLVASNLVAQNTIGAGISCGASGQTECGWNPSFTNVTETRAGSNGGFPSPGGAAFVIAGGAYGTVNGVTLSNLNSSAFGIQLSGSSRMTIQNVSVDQTGTTTGRGFKLSASPYAELINPSISNAHGGDNCLDVTYYSHHVLMPSGTFVNCNTSAIDTFGNYNDYFTAIGITCSTGGNGQVTCLNPGLSNNSRRDVNATLIGGTWKGTGSNEIVQGNGANLTVTGATIGPGSATQGGIAFFTTGGASQGNTFVSPLNFNTSGSPCTSTCLTTASPTSLSFAATNIGLSTASQSITVTNPTASNVVVSSVYAFGDFSQTNNCGTITSSGGTCTVNVTFTPTATGVRTGYLAVYPSSNGGSLFVSLSGNGTGGGTAPSGTQFVLNVNPPSVNANDLYCPVSGVPSWRTVDGPAAMPKVCYHTALVDTPSTGTVVNVSTAAQLTAALQAAACGQQITLAAGSVITGNFTVPAVVCPTSNYLRIQTSAVAALPPEGARFSTTYNGASKVMTAMSPCFSGVTSLPGRPAFNCPVTPGTYTAQLITPNKSPVLTFAAGAQGIRVIGLEITRTAGTGYVAELIKDETGGVNHVIFDRLWCHGDETGDETNTCVYNTAVSYHAVIDSFLNDFYCVAVVGSCSDSHAIAGGINTVNSTTESVHKIVNNFVEAAGENYYYGGGASNTTPSDIERRLNYVFKPLLWDQLDPSYNGGFQGGHPPIVKNLAELKNAQRVFNEGNEYQNIWGGFSQNGSALLLTPKNQAIGTNNVCPNCFVANVTYRYETISSAAAPFQFVNVPSDNGGYAAAGNSYSIHDIVADNLLYPTCYQCTSGVPTLQLWENSAVPTAPQALSNVTVNHITAVYPSTVTTLAAAIGVSGAALTTTTFMSSINVLNSVMWSGTTGTLNEQGGGIAGNCALNLVGTAAFNACWNPYSVTGNCFIKNGSNTWPAGNVTSVASFAAVFTNYNGGNAGNYVLAAGPCKGAASDGSDPGANITVLNSVLAGNPSP